MPYKSKTRRKRTYPRNNQMRTIAKQEARKAIKRQVEVKQHDEVNDTTVSTTINNTDPLQTIVRGTDANDYIGDKINPIGLALRYHLIAGDAYNMLRMLIIQDKDVAGSPTTGTMFQNNIYPLTSALHRDFTSQYRVLYDKTYTLTTNGGGGAIPISKRMFIKGKRMRYIRFDAAGNCTGGQIWIVAISDSSTASHPVFQVYTRLYFTDA